MISELAWIIARK